MAVIVNGLRCAKAAGAVACDEGLHPTARLVVEPIKLGGYYCPHCWGKLSEERRREILAALAKKRQAARENH